MEGKRTRSQKRRHDAVGAGRDGFGDGMRLMSVMVSCPARSETIGQQHGDQQRADDADLPDAVDVELEQGRLERDQKQHRRQHAQDATPSPEDADTAQQWPR